MALAFAQYIFCENKSENDSCGQCSSCQKVRKLIHPDLHFSFPIYSKSTGGSNCDEFLEDWRETVRSSPYMDINHWRETIAADNKQLIIPTKEAENVVKKLALKSFEGGYKIIILWMPELLRTETSNKLLKILEEPPQKTLFFLISNNQESIISTILSRTQLLKIQRIKDLDILEELNKNNIEQGTAEHIIQYSNGNFFKASQMMNNQNINKHFDSFAEWMRKCYMRDFAWLQKWSNEQHSSGRETIKDFIDYSSNMVRQCLISNYTEGKLARLTKEEMEFAQKFARFINDRNSIQINKELELAHLDITRNVYSKLVMFDLSIKMTKLLKM